MRLLIFDLDGTLIDSKEDLVQAVNATRFHMILPPLDPATIASYVGNGAPVLIRRAMGEQPAEERVQQALEFFLSYYREHPLDHTTLYPDVKVTLERLHNQGRQLAVLTNKPVGLSRVILEGLGIAPMFFQVYGGNSFAEKKPHPSGVEALLNETGIANSEAVMIGDSSVDVRTARNAGIHSCGVTYGFQPETLATYPPDVLIDHIGELPDVLEMLSSGA